jgi:DNA-binding NarL/FixJ family response regulator
MDSHVDVDGFAHGNMNGTGNGRGKPDLTRREQEILACVAVGMRNGEIASRLHLAESTVKTHLTSAYLKLGVKNRTQAAIATLSPDQL